MLSEDLYELLFMRYGELDDPEPAEYLSIPAILASSVCTAIRDTPCCSMQQVIVARERGSTRDFSSPNNRFRRVVGLAMKVKQNALLLYAGKNERDADDIVSAVERCGTPVAALLLLHAPSRPSNKVPVLCLSAPDMEQVTKLKHSLTRVVISTTCTVSAWENARVCDDDSSGDRQKRDMGEYYSTGDCANDAENTDGASRGANSSPDVEAWEGDEDRLDRRDHFKPVEERADKVPGPPAQVPMGGGDEWPKQLSGEGSSSRAFVSNQNSSGMLDKPENHPLQCEGSNSRGVKLDSAGVKKQGVQHGEGRQDGDAKIKDAWLKQPPVWQERDPRTATGVSPMGDKFRFCLESYKDRIRTGRPVQSLEFQAIAQSTPPPPSLLDQSHPLEKLVPARDIMSLFFKPDPGTVVFYQKNEPSDVAKIIPLVEQCGVAALLVACHPMPGISSSVPVFVLEPKDMVLLGTANHSLSKVTITRMSLESRKEKSDSVDETQERLTQNKVQHGEVRQEGDATMKDASLKPAPVWQEHNPRTVTVSPLGDKFQFCLESYTDRTCTGRPVQSLEFQAIPLSTTPALLGRSTPIEQLVLVREKNAITSLFTKPDPGTVVFYQKKDPTDVGRIIPLVELCGVAALLVACHPEPGISSSVPVFVLEPKDMALVGTAKHTVSKVTITRMSLESHKDKSDAVDETSERLAQYKDKRSWVQHGEGKQEGDTKIEDAWLKPELTWQEHDSRRTVTVSPTGDKFQFCLRSYKDRTFTGRPVKSIEFQAIPLSTTPSLFDQSQRIERLVPSRDVKQTVTSLFTKPDPGTVVFYEKKEPADVASIIPLVEKCGVAALLVACHPGTEISSWVPVFVLERKDMLLVGNAKHSLSKVTITRISLESSKDKSNLVDETPQRLSRRPMGGGDEWAKLSGTGSASRASVSNQDSSGMLDKAEHHPLEYEGSNARGAKLDNAGGKQQEVQNGERRQEGETKFKDAWLTPTPVPVPADKKLLFCLKSYKNRTFTGRPVKSIEFQAIPLSMTPSSLGQSRPIEQLVPWRENNAIKSLSPKPDPGTVVFYQKKEPTDVARIIPLVERCRVAALLVACHPQPGISSSVPVFVLEPKDMLLVGTAKHSLSKVTIARMLPLESRKDKSDSVDKTSERLAQCKGKRSRVVSGKRMVGQFLGGNFSWSAFLNDTVEWTIGKDFHNYVKSMKYLDEAEEEGKQAADEVDRVASELLVFLGNPSSTVLMFHAAFAARFAIKFGHGLVATVVLRRLAKLDLRIKRNPSSFATAFEELHHRPHAIFRRFLKLEFEFGENLRDVTRDDPQMVHLVAFWVDGGLLQRHLTDQVDWNRVRNNLDRGFGCRALREEILASALNEKVSLTFCLFLCGNLAECLELLEGRRNIDLFACAVDPILGLVRNEIPVPLADCRELRQLISCVGFFSDATVRGEVLDGIAAIAPKRHSADPGLWFEGQLSDDKRDEDAMSVDGSDVDLDALNLEDTDIAGDDAPREGAGDAFAGGADHVLDQLAWNDEHKMRAWLCDCKLPHELGDFLKKQGVRSIDDVVLLVKECPEVLDDVAPLDRVNLKKYARRYRK